MKSTGKICVSTVLLATLAACGGGGDTKPPVTPQAQIQGVASLGVTATRLTGFALNRDFTHLSAALLLLGAETGNSRTVDTACASGSRSAAIDKTTPDHEGFIAGDSVTLTYNNCDVGQNLVFNGTFKATLQGDVLPSVGPQNYDLRFKGELTGFSSKSTVDGIVRNYEGSATFNASATPDGRAAFGFTVPVANNLALQYTGSLPSIKIGYLPGTRFAGTEVTGTAVITQAIEGEVFLTSTTGTENLVITNPTVLAGPTPANGLFNATSGVIDTKSTTRTVATSTTVDGANVSIRGDSDKNSTLDLTFTTTWAALADGQ
jgi:hypothetical protein